MRDDDRESRDFFRTCLCVHEPLGDVSSLIFVNLSAIQLAHLASKGAIFARGGALKSTLVVDNDTTVHEEHTYTVAFSPSVLTKCSVWSTLRVNGSRRRFTAYDTQLYYFTMVAW